MPRAITARELALSTALAAAIGIATGALVADDATPAQDVPRVERVTTRPNGKTPANPDEIDTLAYSSAIRAHLLDAGLGPDDAGRIRATDLLSPPVEPGAVITTGVTLDEGLSAESVTLTGAAIGRFAISKVTTTPTEDGHVAVEVTATNTSADRVRLTALVMIGSP